MSHLANRIQDSRSGEKEWGADRGDEGKVPSVRNVQCDGAISGQPKLPKQRSATQCTVAIPKPNLEVVPWVCTLQ